MAFPLFDTGFTLWAAELDARLMDHHGVTARALGIDARALMERYYRGETVAATHWALRAQAEARP